MASINPPQNKMIFKCNKQAAIVSEEVLNFYKENELIDTVLIAGSDCVHIKAHRVVLCAFSKYFLEQLRGVQNTLQENVLQLEEIEASNLKLIIDFMYTGSIELSLENIDGLLKTALFFKIKTLIEGCYEFIEKNINSSNSLRYLRLAYELSLSTLKTKSLEYIYTDFEKISKQKEFLMLNKEELKDLLFNDNHGDFEESVFLSMVSWINYDKLNRTEATFELLSMIRFRVLSPKFIVENRKSVCKTVEDYELICSWLQWHLSPETRSNDQPNFSLIPRKKTEKLAVIGVNNDKEICIQTFNSKENSWFIEMEKSLLSNRLYSSTIIIDNKLFVVGGRIDGFNIINSVECLDMNTMKWVDFPSMKEYRIGCQLVDLNGYLCVFGWYYNFVPSMEIYNFSTCKWNDIQPMSQPSIGSRITAHNGILYLLDFKNGFLQSYDVSSNKWTSKAVTKSSLYYFGFAAIERFLYVIGGKENGEWVKTVKRYDLFNDSWCEMASLSRSLEFPTTKVLGNKIMICDGCNVDEYNIDIDKWNTLGCLPEKVDWRSVSISNTVFK